MDVRWFIFINFIFIFHVIETTLTQSEIMYFSAIDIHLDIGTDLVAGAFLPISGWWCLLDCLYPTSGVYPWLAHNLSL